MCVRVKDVQKASSTHLKHNKKGRSPSMLEDYG